MVLSVASGPSLRSGASVSAGHIPSPVSLMLSFHRTLSLTSSWPRHTGPHPLDLLLQVWPQLSGYVTWTFVSYESNVDASVSECAPSCSAPGRVSLRECFFISAFTGSPCSTPTAPRGTAHLSLEVHSPARPTWMCFSHRISRTQTSRPAWLQRWRWKCLGRLRAVRRSGKRPPCSVLLSRHGRPRSPSPPVLQGGAFLLCRPVPSSLQSHPLPSSRCPRGHCCSSTHRISLPGLGYRSAWGPLLLPSMAPPPLCLSGQVSPSGFGSVAAFPWPSNGGFWTPRSPD